MIDPRGHQLAGIGGVSHPHTHTPDPGPAPALVLPAGADLRMTWPERQLAIRRMEFRRGMHKLANVELPFLPEFIAKVGGAMPLTFAEMTCTPYAHDMLAFWSEVARRQTTSREIAELMMNAGVRYAFAVEWWEYEGRRSYLLDPTTAHALAHTDISDFPARELRFPVRSFFLRMPQELGWEVSMDRPEAKLSRPKATHPELVQPLDGVHITVDGPTDNPRALQIIIAGRSNIDLAGDHCIWGELRLRHPDVEMTLGDVIGQRMQAEDKWAAKYDIDRKIVGMALGALLYITSSHPDLRPIKPPAESTLNRQERTGSPEVRARAKNRSRYSITYVGGAASGFKEARESHGEEPSDMTRQPPRPHVRVGHFRHVWLGPRDAANRRTEVRWIQPVTVGSWDRVAAWRTEVGYRMVINKTRPAEVRPK